MQNLGTAVSLVRAIRKMTAAKLAKEANICEYHLKLLEQDDILHPEHLSKIAKVLNVSEDFLRVLGTNDRLINEQSKQRFLLAAQNLMISLLRAQENLKAYKKPIDSLHDQFPIYA